MANKHTFIKELSVDWRALTGRQRWFYFLLLLLLERNTMPFFRAIETRVGLSFFASFSNTFLIFIAVIGSVAIFFERIKWYDLIVVVSLAGLHYLSFVLNSDTAFFSLENRDNFLWSCLPLYLVGLAVDTKISPKIFVAISAWAVLIQVIYLSIFGLGVDSEGKEVNEALGAAYNLLPYVCFLAWNALCRGGIINYTIAIVSIYILFTLGARGPIVCIVFFIAAYLIIFKKFRYNVLTKLMIGLLASLIYYFSMEISLFFGVLSRNLGLSSRVFDSIVDHAIVNYQESNGRNDLWSEAIGILKERHIYFDLNFYADRIYNKEGLYCHNLELELLCDFGLIGGGILVIVLFWMLFRAFKKARYSDVLFFMLPFFFASIMQLQFSSSYLILPIFWFYMGVSVAILRQPSNKSQAILERYRIQINNGL